jgi:hypothetical protein
VIDLSSLNVLYAGIATQGVFKTTDGGDSWNPMAVGDPAGTVLSVRLALSHNTPSRVYALLRRVTGDSRLVRTLNAGASWSTVSAFPAPPSGPFLDVLAVDSPDPNNPNNDLVYLGGVDFFRSTNGGASGSFQTISEGELHVDHKEIVKDPSAPATIYFLNDGGIYRSLQQGQDGTWQFCGEGITNVEFYDIASAVTEPDLVIGGTQDNGNIRYDGASLIWNEMGRFGDGATVAIDPTDANVLYAMGQFIAEPNDGGLSKSTDRGNSFQGISRGLPLGLNHSGCVRQNAHFQIHPEQPTTRRSPATTVPTTAAAPGDHRWSP